ncbi:hypothetical protein ACRAWG_15330 [Methylobacterium sp. P31]
MLFALAFSAAAMAFGAIMLISPPVSVAAGSMRSDDGIIQPVTICEFLPTGDVNTCTVYR